MAKRIYINAFYAVVITIAIYLLFIERQFKSSKTGYVGDANIQSIERPDIVKQYCTHERKRAFFRERKQTSNSVDVEELDNKIAGEFNNDEHYLDETDDGMKSFTSDMASVAMHENTEAAKHTPTGVKNLATTGKNFTIGLYNFYHDGLELHARRVNMSSCIYNQCSVKFIHETGNGPFDVDALIFQGNHVPRRLPILRHADQVFVFFSTESPQHLQYTKLRSHKLRDYFNWTMTYRLDSDILYPYGRIVPANYTSPEQWTDYRGGYIEDAQLNKFMEEVYENPTGIEGKDYQLLYEQKTKHSAWLVSHCRTISKREKYVKTMQKIVDIDIFGACSNRSCSRNDTKCERAIAKDYKFYIAFENSLCTDYITEKAYKWFDKDMLVVVRGARNYPVHLPRGTYINANDFNSARELARYLAELGANKDEYIRMLKRKDSFRLVWHRELIQNAYCVLCERLHHLDNYSKSVADIDEWWTKDVCTRPWE